MNRQLEIEYKTLVTREQFHRLMDFFPFNASKKQKNTYFDTKDSQLQKQHWMVRIREVGQTFIFTAKFPVELGHDEVEFELTSFDIDDSRILALLEHHQITGKLYPIGTTTTIRSMYCDSFGCWCLDQTFFDNTMDFEIEYELHAGIFDAKKHYLETLLSLDIEFSKAKSKFARMLEYKK